MEANIIVIQISGENNTHTLILQITSLAFHQLGPLGRFGHRVAMSVCVSVCMSVTTVVIVNNGQNTIFFCISLEF